MIGRCGHVVSRRNNVPVYCDKAAEPIDLIHGPQGAMMVRLRCVDGHSLKTQPCVYDDPVRNVAGAVSGTIVASPPAPEVSP